MRQWKHQAIISQNPVLFLQNNMANYLVKFGPKTLNFKGLFTPSISVSAAATLHDTSDSVLIEINGDAWKWVATPSSQSCHSIDADVWCKRVLTSIST